MSTVSDTAYAVARVRADEHARPAGERLFDDPYAHLFVTAGGHAVEATERFLGMPFVRDAVRLRTRFIDDLVRDEIAAGTRQVVLLGAGFDARGLRMGEIAASGARVFEVDFARQLDHKRAVLAAAGVSVPGHVAYVPCDFMDRAFETDLRARLEASGLRPGAGTLVVWEGVIAYVDDPSIDRSLAFMVRGCGPGTCAVFDYSDFRFQPVPLAGRLRDAGFTGFDSTPFDTLWRRHLSGEPDAAATVVLMGVARVA